jgi:hypothetical protein
MTERKRPSDYRTQWDALQQEAVALVGGGKPRHGLAPSPKVEEHEARVAALGVSKDAVAYAVWETTARDVADVLLLAEIVWDLHWGVGFFPALPADIEDRGQREVAVAYLVRGVFDVSQAQASA